MHSDQHIFEDLQMLVTDLQSSTSTNDKVAILKTVKNNPELMLLLNYMYNPYHQYYVSWKNIQKRSDLYRHYTGDIFTLLITLKDRMVTGHDAIGIVNGYLRFLPEDYHHLVALIFDRSLKVRVDSKLINRVMPGLIPTFDVALATKYEDYSHRIDWDNEDWYWSRKLDGVRVICRVENGSIKFFSRQGKEFHTLDNIAVAINKVTKITDNFVLDGELCIVNENGDEDFTSVIKEIRRKDHTIENPRFKVFDCLTLEEFDSGTSKRLLKERIDDIHWKLGTYLWDSDFPIDRVEMEECESEDDVVYWLDHAAECDWEGIMLRKNDVYKGKRSNDILKVKKMHDDEYIVKDIEYGPFRIIDKELKQEVTIQTMTNVIIEHKGNPVSVGSGFTIDDRNHYYNNPADIVGKEITVQYFEESQDKTGKLSLRFPVCKAVYQNGRQV